MKYVFFINLGFISFCSYLNIDNCKDEYSIKIWDNNYSMAYSIFYSIRADSAIVQYVGGLKKEGDSILMKKKLDGDEFNMISDFFSSHNIYNLEGKYDNPLIDDGDHKRVIIEINGKNKTIEIANFYQKDMSELFDVINRIVNENLKIKYKKPS